MTYELMARYYDLENADLTEDLDFWLELAETYSGPILELGCGTGRVLLNLARRGYEVTGLDNSPAMLARLAAKLQAASPQHLARRPNVVQADMRVFALGQTFHLAIMPFNTFMHLLTFEDQLAALTHIRSHLEPGALLVLDLINPADAYAAQEQGLTLERELQDGDRLVQVFSTLTLDRTAQVAHIRWLYDAIAPDGTVQRTVIPTVFRYTLPGEMRLVLERGGFALTHLYGDYDHTPLADGLPRMIVMATAQ